ncbi:MAG: hypothetical protein BWY95_02593 [Bacteroidetes bacterium ADurb.BinA104]|nr:MAG: hypothetical protein BWY95_02593 [Bacteroidetes bacterium ADurb.BinA104]
MNPKPVIDAIKKVPWNKVMKNTKEVAKTAASVGTAVAVWLGVRDKTRRK